MMLEELLPLVKHSRMILVSGPQRSGTHIMTKILAKELEWGYVYNTDYETDNMGDWAHMVLHGQNIVLHCPQMTHVLHLVPDDVAVVYMYRPLDEIEASFSRVNQGDVSCATTDQMLFYSQIPCVYGRQTGAKWVQVRNAYWEGYQRLILRGRGHYFYYHDLEDHPLFVHNRDNWTMNQTEEVVND